MSTVISGDSGGTAITTTTLPTIAGQLLQVVTYRTGAVATGTTSMPYDDTIPQITEGDQFMSLAITPRSATSILYIDVACMISANPGSGYTMTGALFQDATAGALAALSQYSASDNGITGFSFGHSMVSGTTSSTTFRFRAGNNTGGTNTLNGQQGGARRMGGVGASFIRIMEVAV